MKDIDIFRDASKITFDFYKFRVDKRFRLYYRFEKVMP